MQIANSELALASLVAVLVCCFVYAYTPESAQQQQNNGYRRYMISMMFKVFAVSFCISYVIFYFVHDTKGDCPIDNIYRCEPDF